MTEVDQVDVPVAKARRWFQRRWWLRRQCEPAANLLRTTERDHVYLRRGAHRWLVCANALQADPFRRPPLAGRGDQPFLLHHAQHQTHRIARYSGARSLDVGNRKRRVTREHRFAHLRSLRTATAAHFADALLELAVRAQQYSPKIVQPGIRIVAGLVPPVRTRFKRFVVALLGRLVHALDADVATHFVIQVVESHQPQHPPDAPVAIAEGMDAQRSEDREWKDRKSTRLNSSHLGI